MIVLKNKRILVFTLLMSALLVFSAMPAYSFTEVYLGADSAESKESGTAVESPAGEQVTSGITADDPTSMQNTAADSITTMTDDEKKAALSDGLAVTGTVASASTLIENIASTLADLTVLNLSQVTFTEKSVTLDLSKLKKLTAFSLADNSTAANVTAITLPDTLEEFNGTGTSLTTLTLTSKLTTVILKSVKTLTSLSGLSDLTALKVLNLQGASELTGSLAFASETVIEELDLTGAEKLSGVDLSAAKAAKVLQLSGLTATTEGSVVLPSKAASLTTLNVKGGHFPFINATTTRFPKLTDPDKFIATDQTVSRKGVKVASVFALKDLFADYSVAADDDKTVTIANIGNVTANNGKITSDVEDGEVSWNGDASEITSVEYVYTTDAGDVKVAASDVEGTEGSTNTVGGSGGGCSAGFGALALAAVAAFLLKKSR
jgi:Synergist-CTERM protein sorting domain-containing protein